jgi:hypothetical protein
MKSVENLSTVFTETELEALTTALSGYMCMKRNQNRSTQIERELFNKVVDSLFKSREENAVVVSTFVQPVDLTVSEYKMVEAMENC